MKIRKHNFAIAAIAALSALVLSMTGCRSGTLDTRRLMEDVSMPDEYLITYEIETAEGEFQTVTKGVDADGNIYYRSQEEEALFVKNGGKYAGYELSGGASGDETSTGEYNIDYVDNATARFTELVENSKSKYSGGAERIGETTVAGAVCDEYEISVTVANFTQKYNFAVSKDYDICLSWNDATSVGGYDASDGNENFVCTEFIVENAKLPVDIPDYSVY